MTTVPELPSPDDFWNVPVHAGAMPRKHPWAKNLVAVFLGSVAGLFLRGVIAIPLFFIFRYDNSLPPDLMLILELFTAFIAGATTGTLVPRYGWIFGLLTQTLKIVVTLLVIAGWAYLVVTDSEIELSLDLLRAPAMRLMLFAMITAGIGGFVGERYRDSLMSFLGHTFGAVAGGIGCLTYALGGVAQLWFLYLGGRAFFEERAIFKALMYVFLVGPAVSYGFSLLIMGILGLGAWAFKRLYNWYAPDLDLGPLDW